MNDIIKKLVENIPTLTTIILLTIIHILGFEINLLGVYMFGELLGKNNMMKVIIAATWVTLIIDAISMHIIGTWALSFFIGALLIEICLRVIKVRNELEQYHIRNNILLTCAITLGALAQTTIRQWLTEQTQIIQIQHIISIVIASMIYVAVRNMNNKKAMLEYIKRI